MRKASIFLLSTFFFSIFSIDDFDTCDITGSYQHTDYDYQEGRMQSYQAMNSMMNTIHADLIRYMNSPEYQQRCLKEEEKKQKEKELSEKKQLEQYGITAEKLHEVLKYKKDKLEQWIIQTKDLSRTQAIRIWNDHCINKQWWYDRYDDPGRDRIEAEFDRRAEEKKKAEDQKRQLQQQEQDQLKKSQEIYTIHITNSNEFQSPYQNQRVQTLQQTVDQNYKKYEQTHELDVQILGMMQTRGINTAKFNNLSGTAMQHQLYSEVADCYKIIAQYAYDYGFIERSLANYSLNFADCAFGATQLEVMELAIRLSDVAHLLANTTYSIFQGVSDSVLGIVDMIAHPIDTAKNLGYCLGKVMQYVAEAHVHANSESFGWSYYAQQLEREHAYDAVYANAIIDNVKMWILESSVHDKVRMSTRLIADSIVYPKIFAAAGKICTTVLAELPEIRFLESFADLYTEYGVVTELGEVGLASMEDVGMLLMKSEMKMASEAKAISSLEQASGKRVIDEIFEKQEYYKKYKPTEVKTNCLLEKNLKIAVDAEKDAARIKKLPDGRVRFYETERLSTTPGPTRGSSYVIEYDPNKGVVRSWYESYDHAGTVNRVHPKMTNGREIKSLHYPHTGKELAEMANNMKRK